MEDIRCHSSTRKKVREGIWHLFAAVPQAENRLASRWVSEGDLKDGTFKVSLRRSMEVHQVDKRGKGGIRQRDLHGQRHRRRKKG